MQPWSAVSESTTLMRRIRAAVVPPPHRGCAGTAVTICVPRIFPPHLGDTPAQVWVTRAPVSRWLISPYLSSPTPLCVGVHWGVMSTHGILCHPPPPPQGRMETARVGSILFLVRGTMVDGAQLGESPHTGAAYRVVRGTAQGTTQGTRGTTQGSRGCMYRCGMQNQNIRWYDGRSEVQLGRDTACLKVRDSQGPV